MRLSISVQDVNLNGNGSGSAARQQSKAAAAVEGQAVMAAEAASVPFAKTIEDDGVEGIQMSDRRTGQTGMFVRVSNKQSTVVSSTVCSTESLTSGSPYKQSLRKALGYTI